MVKNMISIDLKEKVVLITGGAKGIGQAISKGFAASGASVAVNYLTSEKNAKELVEQFQANGIQAVAIKADITVPEDVEHMFDQIEKQLGSTVDILINNAGTQIALSSVEQMPMDIWNKSLALNLTSTMICSKYAIPGMKEKGWGRIINVSSISARSGGGPGGTSYASAKGGMSTFTKGLAKELGLYGITVNAIAPGVILTDIHKKFSTPEDLEKLKSQTALGRLGQPEDIAGSVLFLASDSASYITGETISINGGLRMD
ncbi:MAG: 3-oxoacyl-ACP reductase family protein [bacterium]|nr:3-oxoacyl-ACP reductase family protein [bacterium]